MADELKDLFEVPQETDNDMAVDDLLSVTDGDVFGGSADMSDITGVSRTDVMGKPPPPLKQPTPVEDVVIDDGQIAGFSPQPQQRFGIARPGRRIVRRVNPPPTSMGGFIG